MDDASDHQLVTALGSDPAAFEVFYRRHVAKVVGFATRRLGDPEQVADLVAAVFLAAIESCHRFDRRRGQPLPWLLGIATHVLLAQQRQARSEDRAWQRVIGRRHLDPDDYARLEEQIDARLLSENVRAAMATLPAGERQLLELVGLEGLTPTEAAGAVGIHPAAARTRRAPAARPSQPAPRRGPA